jgi:hypothetical protein
MPSEPKRKNVVAFWSNAVMLRDNRPPAFDACRKEIEGT